MRIVSNDVSHPDEISMDPNISFSGLLPRYSITITRSVSELPVYDFTYVLIAAKYTKCPEFCLPDGII